MEADEIIDYACNLGVSRNAASYYVNNLIQEYDTDNNGKFEVSEFRNMLHEHSPHFEETELKESCTLGLNGYNRI